MTNSKTNGLTFQDACERLTAAIDGLIEIEAGTCDDMMLFMARKRVEIAREAYLTAEG